MEKDSNPADSCADCKGLRAGTRSTQDPHQYLVLLSRGSQSGESRSATYRCLVCKTELTYEQPKGQIASWK